MGTFAPINRLFVLLGCLGLLALGVASSASAQPRFGLSDYEPSSFSDPRVRQLGVHMARDVVPWNVALVRRDRLQMTAWLDAVKRARGGIVPFITFQHADRGGRAPSPGQFLRAFLAFRKLYPWVHEFAPWDEANHSSQPTVRNPRLVAEYYNLLVAHCRGCLITAPDLLDSDPFERWALSFARYAHPYPKVWPFNPYHSVSIDSPARIQQLLQTVRGQIWFSEVGGVVWWKFRGHLVYHGPAYAARMAHHIFRLAEISPRIARIYYYHWRSPGVPGHMPRNARWDAGLIDHNGRARPALWVVARELHRHVQGAIPKTF